MKAPGLPPKSTHPDADGDLAEQDQKQRGELLAQIQLVVDSPATPFSHIKEPKKRAFLAAYIVSGGNVVRACQLIGIHPVTPYSRPWKTDTELQRLWRGDATEWAADFLEAEAVRRATEGTVKPTGWHKGKPGGYIREYSDILLIFLLKGARPDKFADRVQLRGSLAHIDVNKLPDHMLARIADGEHPLAVLASPEKQDQDAQPVDITAANDHDKPRMITGESATEPPAEDPKDQAE